MFKPLSKSLLIITLLIAFIGQTLAYHFEVSYDTMSEPHTKVQVQTFDSNDNGTNLSQSTNDCCDVDCCESECICPANACASMVYLNISLSLLELVPLSETLLSLTAQSTHFIATSPFRPPIFTS